MQGFEKGRIIADRGRSRSTILLKSSSSKILKAEKKALAVCAEGKMACKGHQKKG